MKLISWNVNGIRAIHRKGFNRFLNRHKPDLLAIQETKAWTEQLEDKQQNPGKYTGYYAEASKKGYSGVSTMLREKTYFKPKKLQYGIGKPKFDSEGRFVISHHRDFDLYNIYFPSGSSGDLRQAYKYKFLNALYGNLKDLSKRERNRLVICGDYNICHRPIDIHHPREAERLELSGFLPEERAWMDKFAELGFVDAYRHVHGDRRDKYTWWSYRGGAREKNLGWRIDYFFVGKGLVSRVQNATILSRTMGSDHCPIVLELDARTD